MLYNRWMQWTNVSRKYNCSGAEETIWTQTVLVCGDPAEAMFDGDVLCTGWRISVDRWCSLILSVPFTSHPPSLHILPPLLLHQHHIFRLIFRLCVQKNTYLIFHSVFFVTLSLTLCCLLSNLGCSSSVLSVEGNIVLLWVKKWPCMFIYCTQSQPSVT